MSIGLKKRLRGIHFSDYIIFRENEGNEMAAARDCSSYFLFCILRALINMPLFHIEA